MEYLVVVERGHTSYGAYVPDLPGCVAAADSREEVETRIREAVQLHVQDLRQGGLPAPEPTCTGRLVTVNA